MNTKKKLLAIAIANALAMPLTANAGLEIYGTVGVAVESMDNDSTVRNSSVSNNHSALGFKGSTSLGEGVKGVFMYDMFLGIDDSDSGGNGLLGNGRDGYLGVQSKKFGTVALGFHGRPYKTSTNDMDVFGSTIADYSAVMGATPGGENFDDGLPNSVIWFMPKFGKITGHAQYQMDEGHNAGNGYGFQVNYSEGPMFGVVSYDVNRNGSSAANVTAIKFAGSFKLGGGQKVSAIYEILSSDNPSDERSALWLAGSMKTGKFTFKAAYAQASDTDAAGDDAVSMVTVGAEHQYGKSLSTYALYSTIDNGDAGAYTFTAEPHTSSNNNTAVNAGDGASVIAVGLKYNFSKKM